MKKQIIIVLFHFLSLNGSNPQSTKVLNIIIKTFGGWQESGGKSVPRWVIGGEKARTLSKQMLPYLVVKKNIINQMLKSWEKTQ